MTDYMAILPIALISFGVTGAYHRITEWQRRRLDQRYQALGIAVGKAQRARRLRAPYRARMEQEAPWVVRSGGLLSEPPVRLPPVLGEGR